MGRNETAERDVGEYLQECVAIEPLAIQEEYVRIPADLAYWNEKYSQALRAYLLAKIERDRTKASVQLEVREAMLAAGAKATEAKVEATVIQDEEYLAAARAYANAEADKARLFGVVDSLRAKKDMLISLGAHLRVEMEGDPLIRDQVRGSKMR